jgi:hypothetical protein
MFCIISKERIGFYAQVEGTQAEIFAMSPIGLHSRCNCVPNEPILAYGRGWPQRHSDRLQKETNRARITGEPAIGGRYATRHVVLRPSEK